MPDVQQPDERRELRFRVIGVPARQGSKDFKGMRRGRPILVEADPNLPKWRRDVIAAAHNAIRATEWLVTDEPCEVWVTFLLPRPKSVKREWPDSQNDGDGDKYVRGLFDALTYAKVWTNDARCVRHHASKEYARPGQPTGAIVRVVEMMETLC